VYRELGWPSLLLPAKVYLREPELGSVSPDQPGSRLIIQYQDGGMRSYVPALPGRFEQLAALDERRNPVYIFEIFCCSTICIAISGRS